MSEAAVPDVALLAQKAAALPDETMRSSMLAEHLNELDPDDAVLLINEILSVQRKSTRYLTLLDALTAALSTNAFSYQLCSDLYASAKEQGLMNVCNILTEHPPADLTPAPEHGGLDPKMAEAPLGRRKWLARKPNPNIIDRLLHDPDPAVIRNLLHNPRLTTAQVLRIAAKRPIPPAVLEEIVQHRRWRKHYDIRRAVVLNPYTPLTLATRLASGLLDQDLSMIAKQPACQKTLRATAQHLLELRRNNRQQGVDDTDDNKVSPETKATSEKS